MSILHSTDATFIACFIAAFLLSLLITAWTRRIALRHGVLSQVTDRSSHTQPTPRLGGVGLALGFALPTIALIGLWWKWNPDLLVYFNGSLWGWIGIGWLAIFLVGLADDLLDLAPPLKFSLMLVSVAAPCWALGGASFPFAIILLWILFFTNAFNFMDGMDGLAASFAGMAAVFLFFAALIADGFIHLRIEALLLPILFMACLGFLAWNLPPARVFMGDCGSLSVGYILSVYVVLGANGDLGDAGAPVSPLTSLTILMPFIFDVALTLARRAIRGEKLWRAHREHLYQRLMQTGLSHGQVLQMNLWRFGLCGVAALAGQAYGSWAARLGAMALALILMLHYWRRTLAREWTS